MIDRDDYITRGLFYLMGWFLTMPFILPFLGVWAFGMAGMPIGLIASVVLGLVGYKLYLDWQGKKCGG